MTQWLMVLGGVKLLEENAFGVFLRDMIWTINFIQGILGELLPTSNYNSFFAE